MSTITNWVSGKIRVFVYSRFFLFLLGLIIGSTAVFCYINGLEFWDDLYKNDGGLVIRPVEAAGPGVAPVTGLEGLNSPLPVQEIVDRVFQLESSSDKNDGCHGIGKHNGFGWRQNRTEWNCYNYTEEVRGYVTEWFVNKLENGVPLENALCIYNKGIDENQCDYLTKFYSL